MVAPGTFGESFEPALLLILPPGAFLVLGFLVAGMNMIDRTDFAAIFGLSRARLPQTQSQPGYGPEPEPVKVTVTQQVLTDTKT